MPKVSLGPARLYWGYLELLRSSRVKYIVSTWIYWGLKALFGVTRLSTVILYVGTTGASVGQSCSFWGY